MLAINYFESLCYLQPSPPPGNPAFAPHIISLLISNSENKIICLFKITLFIVLMNKEGSTKIVDFMTTGAWFIVLRCGHI